MRHQEGFREGKGGRLFWQGWRPEGETLAVLVLVHGLAEHSGRYGNLVDRLVPRGYALYGMDHPGHGRSPGRPLYIARFQDYADAQADFLDEVRKANPGKPVFVVGHSMGGLIAALLLLDHQEGLAGAVLSGPAIQPPESLPPPVLAIGRLLSRLCPSLGLLPLDSAGISRDAAVVEAYRADPLVSKGRLTARLGAELLSAMALIRREAGRIALPLLIQQGDADRLVDPAGAQLLYDRAGSADKRLIRYAGLFHEVYNEPERAQVLADLEQWLSSRVPGHEGPPGKR